MRNQMTTAVTGATGQLGGLVIDELLARGVAAADVVAIVRDESKASTLVSHGVSVRVADYDDPASLVDALVGVDKLLLVSGSAVGQRVAQHTNVIEAAEANSVELIAYTKPAARRHERSESGSRARRHRSPTERVVGARRDLAQRLVLGELPGRHPAGGGDRNAPGCRG
jgi:uncharacterized protein YbjT (DUF2867 family)